MARQRCPEVFSNQIYIYGMGNLCFDCRIVTSSNTSRLEAHADLFQIAYEGDF